MSQLDKAPAHVKLAVDLILILEENNIAPDVVLDALTIVRQDCQSKIDQDKATVTSQSSVDEDD
jgi:hypothetical protein